MRTRTYLTIERFPRRHAVARVKQVLPEPTSSSSDLGCGEGRVVRIITRPSKPYVAALVTAGFVVTALQGFRRQDDPLGCSSCGPSGDHFADPVLVRSHLVERSVRCAAVVAWKAIEQAEPEFAGRVRRLFEAGRHKTIATLRADGSPRISGIECEFTDGDLRFGSMSGHARERTSSGTPASPCTARPSTPRRARRANGRARRRSRDGHARGPVTTDEASGNLMDEMFVADITEVVITGLNAEATRLVVESWTPERGLRRVERD